jgi:pumilio homology domain family member 6
MPKEVGISFLNSIIFINHHVLCPSDKSAASKALLEALTAPYPSADSAKPHLISFAHSSRLYKTLLQGGPFSHQTKAVIRSEFWSPTDFAQEFVKVVGKDNTLAMAKDDGAFVVAVLCERAQDSAALKKQLKGWFDASVKKELMKDKERRGRSMLLQQIEAL